VTDTSNPGPPDEVDEIVEMFLVESQEALDELNADLVELEREPLNTDCLNTIFRAVHTIKGTSGALGFLKVQAVAHVAENLLSRLRDREFALNSNITNALLLSIDAFQAMLQSIEATGAEGERDDAALIETLEQLAVNGGEARMIGEILTSAGTVEESDVAEALEQQKDNDDPRHVGEILVEMGRAEPAGVVDALRAQQTEARSTVADNNVRIDIGLLDRLMDLVGELVLARNQLVQYTADADEKIAGTSQRMSLITTELQEGVMKTRMQPIDTVWSRFPRAVRDLAVSCGKQVALELEGRDTELDRSIIEAVRDPLTHLIRNAIDHGIERPEDRVAAGKPAEGRLLLRAFHEGGRVNIEVSDDGGGIDLARVRAKALARGMVSEDRLATMSERDILELLFLPGFSTAEVATNVSGRGVGMDVVKTNVEKIGGTIEITSSAGHGTSVKIKIPLTLAIIPALIVTTGNERYAIPQVSLLELVHLDGGNRDQLEYVADAPVYRLRGSLLPLVNLAAELGIEPMGSKETLTIVVLQADGETFGLVVDEVHDTEDIVVKPLGHRLKHISAFSGATIMGDGRVALILDVLGLAHRAGIARDGEDINAGADTADAAALVDTNTETLLLVAAGGHKRLAIPLSKVSRIEEIPLATIEHAGGHDAVQYREQIMPLVYVADVLGEAHSRTEGQPLSVVVYKAGELPVALVVDEIIDTVDDHVIADTRVSNSATLSSAIVAGQITELLDVEAMTAAYTTGTHRDLDLGYDAGEQAIDRAESAAGGKRRRGGKSALALADAGGSSNGHHSS
jgi:two-component system chemotaxis sensor kinase CheA